MTYAHTFYFGGSFFWGETLICFGNGTRRAQSTAGCYVYAKTSTWKRMHPSINFGGEISSLENPFFFGGDLNFVPRRITGHRNECQFANHIYAHSVAGKIALSKLLALHTKKLRVHVCTCVRICPRNGVYMCPFGGPTARRSRKHILQQAVLVCAIFFLRCTQFPPPCAAHQNVATISLHTSTHVYTRTIAHSFTHTFL